MSALSLFNNFEREFTGPFFRKISDDNWPNEFVKSNVERVFPSVMKYDESRGVWALMVELAGVIKDDIKIDTTDGYLRLTGEKTKGVNTGKFEGLYHLPEGVDLEKISATFENGVLNVDIPVAEKKLTKNIQIK